MLYQLSYSRLATTHRTPSEKILNGQLARASGSGKQKILKVKRCMLLLVAPACVGTLAKVLVRLRLVLPRLASPHH